MVLEKGERIEYDDLGLTASTNTAALLLSSSAKMERDIFDSARSTSVRLAFVLALITFF